MTRPDSAGDERIDGTKLTRSHGDPTDGDATNGNATDADSNGPVCGMDGLSYAGGIQLNTMAVSTPEAAERLLPDGASFETISFSEGSPLDAAVPRWA